MQTKLKCARIFFLSLIAILLILTGCDTGINFDGSGGPSEEINSEGIEAKADEPSLADVTAKIDVYIQRFIGSHAYVNDLVELKLMTQEQLDSLHNRMKDEADVYLQGGMPYWQTGVSSADFERVCLQYMSKSHFDEAVSSGLLNCCLKVENDQLIIPNVGHGGWRYSNLRDITFLGVNGVQYRYMVTADYNDEDGFEPNNKIVFAFILENGSYVIDEVK
ncbi:MAG: hypothetical protein LBB49_06200 [Gracilibacteraceae bacterium]|jgi:hypothetical protein|nr:hypothetical protein [Gracilibacteraceae bacterium]